MEAVSSFETSVSMYQTTAHRRNQSFSFNAVAYLCKVGCSNWFEELVDSPTHVLKHLNNNSRKFLIYLTTLIQSVRIYGIEWDGNIIMNGD
jgi:hypothetical protein